MASNKEIVLVTDFDMTGGSGYYSICAPLFSRLAVQGFKITVLGIAYNGEEHQFPFTVIPVSRRAMYDTTRGMIHNLCLEQNYAGQVVVALDIPVQEIFLNKLREFGVLIPYVGIFPIEARPLGNTWAQVLGKMDKRLVLSRFGAEECVRNNLDAAYLPVTVNTEAWRPPSLDERMMLRRAMGISDDSKVVLSVADNQERKNLPAAFSVVERLKHDGVDVFYLLVTRRDSPAGWLINDLKLKHDISDITLDFNRGMEFKKLWSLFAMADVVLFTSKAEGVCMPCLEAMSAEIPVVAPDHTSFSEHLTSDRGWLCKNAFIDEGAFGNEYRYYVDVDDAFEKVKYVLGNPDEARARALKAKQYMLERTWEGAADVLAQYIG